MHDEPIEVIVEMLPAAPSTFYLTNEDHATAERGDSSHHSLVTFSVGRKFLMKISCREERGERETVTSNHMKNVVGIFYHLAKAEAQLETDSVWSHSR